MTAEKLLPKSNTPSPKKSSWRQFSSLNEMKKEFDDLKTKVFQLL